MRRPAKRFTCPVAGVTFVADYPDNLLDLASVQRRKERRGDDEPLTVILRRNPENAYDANAIEVHQPHVGMLGHVPKEIAERLAPCLDDGEIWQAWLGDVRIHPDNPEQPGVDIKVEHVPEGSR